MSLTDCIRKAGKALSSKDADAIQSLADDFEASGMLRQEAEQKAVEQHVTALQGEIDGMQLELAQKHGYEGQDKHEASRWERAVAKGLDMSPEARKQRAAEQGYDVDTKLYHGTGEDLTTMDTGGGKGRTFGTGLFLTDNPAAASTYGKGSAGRNVIPVYAKLKNPMVLDAGGKAWNQISGDEVITYPDGTQDPISYLVTLDDDGVISTDDLARLARRMGNDGLVVENVIDRGGQQVPRDMQADTLKPSTITVVFDHTQVRSVHAAFDPDETASADLLAQQEGGITQGTTLMKPGAPVISLSTVSDMSTFLHETMHLFMLMEQQFAKEFGITANQQAMLESVGVTSFDQLTRTHHEQLAESFEIYLREGKAPSVKLMDAFNTFRAWLIQVYKSIYQRPNNILDDKLRAAFDRLLATEEEIQQAAASPAFAQMFRSKEQAGMTDAEWQAYQEAKAKRDGRAITTIEQKIINEMKRRKTKEWKQERDILAKEEEARLAETPVYKILADTLKRTDNTLERPMDRESIKVLLGVDKVTGAWIRRTSNDGTDPQLFSEANGYETVEEMVKDLNEAKPLKEAATEAAEERMKQKYGDILNDGTLEAEVMTALHNTKDVDRMYAELRALDSTQALNRDLIKAEARRIIGLMKNSEIRPSKFHQNMIRASQRAATSSIKAEQILAKQQQLVNHYLYKEAVKAKKNIDKYKAYVNKVKKQKYSTRQVAPDYVHTMKMLANLYTSKSETTEADIKKLVEFFNGQVEAMTGITLLDPQLIVAVEADKRGDTIKPIMMDNMTVSELTGLYTQLKNLRFVGGRMSEERAEAFRQRTAALTQSVIDNGGKTIPTAVAPGPFDFTSDSIKEFLNAHPSLRNFVRRLDGGNDYGEAFKQIYLLTEDANNNKMRMHRELYERYQEELKNIDQVSLKRYGTKSITLDDGSVIKVHGEARLMMALYWGTESSRQALRDGHGVTDADMMRILADMIQPELELVNAIWRLNESLWPEAVKAHVARHGVAPEKLTPVPFVVNGVQMTGGHMRLYYNKEAVDPNTIQSLGEGEFDSIVTSTSGTMKERVGSGGKKVLLDKANITRSINDIIHYTAFANPSVELAALLNDKAFKKAVQDKHGTPFYNGMVNALRSVVTGKKDREYARWLASLTRVLRRNLTAMHLMYSVRNAVQQFSAVFPVIEEVGPVDFMRSAIDFMLPGNEHVKFVNNSSEFMRNRSQLVNREAHEQLHNIAFGGPVTRTFKTINDYGFFMQTTIDSMFAYPTWKAKYESEMEKHGNHRIAVSMADTAVSESVGSGSDLHLGSAFQTTRNETIKAVTQFGSFFNSVIYQRYQRAKIRGDKTGMFMALAAQPILLGIFTAIITMDVPDDDDELPKWFFEKWGSQLAGMYMVVRDIYAAWQGFNKRGIIQGGTSAPVMLADSVMMEEVKPGKVLRATATLVPIPGAGQLARMMDFIESDDDGKERSDFKYYQMMVEGKDRNK